MLLPKQSSRLQCIWKPRLIYLFKFVCVGAEGRAEVGKKGRSIGGYKI